MSRTATWAPPAAAWAAGLLLLCGAAHATGHDPLQARTWARFDSKYYVQIAQHGYDVHRCPLGNGRSKWCGNAAWFPGYSLVLAPLLAAGLPALATALVVSWLAWLATLVLLWRWYLPRRAGPLVCAAFLPGVVYLYAVFPLSLLTLAGIVFLRFLDRRPVVAGAAGAVAGLAYPVGMALVPALAVVAACRRRREGAPVARALVLGGPAILCGLGIVLEQWLQTGRWTAYFDVAGSYGGLHDPVTSVTDQIRVLVDAADPAAYALAPVWQFLLVTVLLAAVTIAAVRLRRALYLVLWCAGVWFVPLLQTQQSLWRSEAGLVALPPLLALLPRRLVWAAAAALAVVAFGLAHEFFAGTLI